MNNVFISVLMTSYNCASYIRQAVQSILNQTYKDLELVIIDDGSNDNTEEIISAFSDSRIKYKKISHYGRSNALNYGLSICNSDWISIADADDIAHPLKLEKQISLLSGTENEICFTDSAFFKGSKILFVIENNFNSMTVNNILALHGHFNNSTFLFNKSHILKYGGYKESLETFEDYDLWLRIKDNSKFIFVKETLQFSRIRNNSLTSGNLKLSKKNIYEIQKPHYLNVERYFGIEELYEQISFKGWREFFYGNKNLCRDYWNKINLNKWNSRMFLAYLISFFPADFVNYFNKLKVRLRLKYLFDKKTKFKGLDKEFHKLLKEVSR
ncbi:MAG: glycosyltransferase [Ignavibacteriales bacterium]|nr:glycosyltransferase [Ignavibacteriales bacterium]